MTAQPNAIVRFRRAIQTGSVTLAVGAASELGRLGLADALALTLLIAAREPHRYGRYAARWFGRYCSEQPRVELADAELLLALLTALLDKPRVAVRGLEVLFGERGEHELAAAVRRWHVDAQPSR